MRLTIDMDKKELIHEVAGKRQKLNLFSKEAFELISDIWLKACWSL